jgi:DNA-binding LacI/PurR family transcriptional regulator
MPTIKDVARLAEVSPATVSYVLNGRWDGDGTISEATRTRVLAAVAELGYVPNQTARNLRRQRTERVCLVLSHLGVPYSDAWLRITEQSGANAASGAQARRLDAAAYCWLLRTDQTRG